MDRIGAEIGADRALLEDRDRRRQRAGAQQQRQIARRLHREAARDDAAAAEDRLADHRRADHLVVEHDRERLADILARRVAEAPRAGRVEPEADHRLVVLEGRLRVDQRVAADHDARLARHRPSAPAAVPRSSSAGRISSPGGRRPRRASSTRHAGVDQLEGQLGGLAEQRLDVLGIVDAGQLDQDAVLRLARWIVGSLVPVSSMRRRMISIDCSTAWLRRASVACVLNRIVARAVGADHRRSAPGRSWRARAAHRRSGRRRGS